MSKRSETAGITGDERQLVSFSLGKETFGVDVAQVREIGKVEEITRVPRMPDFIEGVMNLRGQVTTVIDLRRRFGITGDGGQTSKSRIIVAEIQENQLGIIVDSVKDVIRVDPRDIMPPPKSLVGNVDARFLTGICKHPGRLIMVLDLSALLSDEEMEQVLVTEQGEGAPVATEVVE